jgi:hypothetical protein
MNIFKTKLRKSITHFTPLNILIGYKIGIEYNKYQTEQKIYLTERTLETNYRNNNLLYPITRIYRNALGINFIID